MTSFFQKFEHSESSSSYFTHLLTFPFANLLSYTPWLFLVWPAYCIAFQPLEKDPILGQFLRTVTFSLFYFFWLFPEVRFEVLVPLIGPLSVLTGLNYDILVRRYGKQLLYLPKFISLIALATIVICVTFGLIKDWDVLKLSQVSILDIIFLATSLMLAFIIIKARLNLQIWFLVALSVVALRLAFFGAYHGLFAKNLHGEKQQLAMDLSKNLPSDTTVYEMITSKESFPGECYYLNRPVVKINDVRELPYYEDSVFVLSKNQIPIFQNRSWFPVSEVIPYKNYHLRMWKGEKRLIEINPDRLEFRFNMNANSYEHIAQNVLISHRLSMEIDIKILDSELGYLEILTPREQTIRPGEVFEFEIRVVSGFVPKKEIFDFVPIQFRIYKKNLSRSISVAIKPISDL